MTSSAYTVVEVDSNEDQPCTCGGGCGWKGTARQTVDIQECALTAGDASPVGRCPECESLAYVDDKPPFTEFDAHQRLLLDTYEDGELSHTEPAQADDCGDGLLRFLLDELSIAQDCVDHQTAVNRLDKMIEQLRQVQYAFCETGGLVPDGTPFIPRPEKPVVVVDLDGGAIHNVRGSAPVRVIILDADIEGGDPDNIHTVDGQEIYLSDYNIGREHCLGDRSDVLRIATEVDSKTGG